MNQYSIVLGVMTLILIIIIYEYIFTDSWEVQYHTISQKSFHIEQNIENTQDPNVTIENKIENLPEIYLKENMKLPSQYNSTCAKFPKLLDIEFTNDQWQTQKTTNGTLQLFNAYVDDRNVKNDQWAVRITAMYDQFDANDTFYCQMWFEQVDKPVIVNCEKLIWSWNKGWGGNGKGWYHSYIVTCLLPEKNKIPSSVSVVENYCDTATNNLRIFYNGVEENEKKNFVVCVKGLNFPYEDRSIRLAEWIELLFILGAGKIHFYEFNVHPNMKKLLNFYSSDKVEVTPLTLVGGAVNKPFLQTEYLKHKVLKRRLQEVISYNDCLYKNLQEFRFVVLLDPDEVIVPAEGTWDDLLNRTMNQNKSSYVARNVYFFDDTKAQFEELRDIPPLLHMLRHIKRSKIYTGTYRYVKGFHNTSSVVALHNHFPIRCLSGCSPIEIHLELAHSQHYRSDCHADVTKEECAAMKKNTVTDTRVWNYKTVLIQKTLDVLNYLNISTS